MPYFWRSMREFLVGTVVEVCELLTLNRLQKLVRALRENGLGLVNRAQMKFKTCEVSFHKNECVTIIMASCLIVEGISGGDNNARIPLSNLHFFIFFCWFP